MLDSLAKSSLNSLIHVYSYLFFDQLHTAVLLLTFHSKQQRSHQQPHPEPGFRGIQTHDLVIQTLLYNQLN